MTASLIAALLSLSSLVILCGPPALALRMLVLRLRWARPQRRMVYLILSALTVLLLVFNMLVSVGVTAPLQALTPPVVSANLVTTALLFAWATAGLCALLVVIAPRRGGASHI
jgi:hypothetical protein